MFDVLPVGAVEEQGRMMLSVSFARVDLPMKQDGRQVVPRDGVIYLSSGGTAFARPLLSGVCCIIAITNGHLQVSLTPGGRSGF